MMTDQECYTLLGRLTCGDPGPGELSFGCVVEWVDNTEAAVLVRTPDGYEVSRMAFPRATLRNIGADIGSWFAWDTDDGPFTARLVTAPVQDIQAIDGECG